MNAFYQPKARARIEPVINSVPWMSVLLLAVPLSIGGGGGGSSGGGWRWFCRGGRERRQGQGRSEGAAEECPTDQARAVQAGPAAVA